MRVKLQLYTFQRHGRGTLISGMQRNQMLAPLGAVVLLAGFLAKATDYWAVADYALAAGLLCYLIAWFDNWWSKTSRASQRPLH